MNDSETPGEEECGQYIQRLELRYYPSWIYEEGEKMADLTRQYHSLEPNGTQSNTQDIQNQLDQLLDDAYDCRHISNLKTDFLEACFERIDPDQSWEEFVKSHENYSDNWRRQKKLATALRMLMTQQIGWPENEGIRRFQRKYLVGILVAIKASDQGISRSEDHAQISFEPNFDQELLYDEAPERSRPELDFPTLLTFSDTIKPDAKALLEEKGISPITGNHHVVYVIDCTPDTYNETSRITSTRQQALAKMKTGAKLSKREEAAKFLNESKGILYVGYSHEFPRRMERHHTGSTDGSADFLNLYKPQRLLKVTDYPSEEEARSQEVKLANKLRRETDCFVYQA